MFKESVIVTFVIFQNSCKYHLPSGGNRQSLGKSDWWNWSSTTFGNSVTQNTVYTIRQKQFTCWLAWFRHKYWHIQEETKYADVRYKININDLDITWSWLWKIRSRYLFVSKTVLIILDMLLIPDNFGKKFFTYKGCGIFFQPCDLLVPNTLFVILDIPSYCSKRTSSSACIPEDSHYSWL